MDRHRSFLDQRYFPLLDGLRCLAILGVVWYHAAGQSYASGPLSRGFEGVALFFVISGFLITSLLLRERSNTGDISLKSFYLRRTLRIFPVYYAVLSFYIILVFFMERRSEAGVLFWHNLPFFMTYTSNWFVGADADRIIFLFSWSLATEEQFYVFWPWIVRSARIAVPIMVMILLIFAQQFASAYRDTSLIATVLASISPFICAGSLVAIALHHRTSFHWVWLIVGWPGSSLAAFAALVSTLIFDGLPSWALVVTVTWFVTACVLRPADQPLAWLLTCRPVKHIGTVSYGVYLLNILCSYVVRHLFHLESGVLVFILALPLSVLVATLSFRFYEAPFLQLKARLGGARRQRPLLAPAE
jgi:peptidoglycan/LPS O-acetylase OafA/YrhL